MARRRCTCAVWVFRRCVAATPRLRRGYSVELRRGDAAAATGKFGRRYTGDTLLDADDLDLLGSGLTRADDPDDPRIQGRRSLFAWIEENGAELGKEYISSRTRYYAVK